MTTIDPVRTIDRAALDAATDRVTLKLLDRASGARTCSVSCIKTPPGGGSPEGMHTHEVDQIFYVLAGTMGIEVGDARREVGAGSLVVFPAGVAHRNWNAGSDATLHLSITSPLPDPDKPFATRVAHT